MGLTLLVANIPAVILALLAVFLIHDGQPYWVWAWFLAFGFYITVSPKGDD